MALRAIMLRKQIELREKALKDVEARGDELKKREDEYRAAIDEMTKPEEEETLNETGKKIDEDRAAWEAEIAEKKAEIEALRTELDGIEAEAKKTPPEKPEQEERKDEQKMLNREMKGLAEMVTREDVKAYLGEVRTAMREKRAITNVGLTIPEVMLGLLKENIEGYSKLYRHINVRRIGGEGRMLIMGEVPEAIWTDCCANLNELGLGFNDLEMDCYKVAGFFAVCNANLEDSDVNLAGEILSALGQAIGLALDKAILYGRNAAATAKMPQGIVSRLAQTAAPTGYPATARTWVDLHTSNMITVTAANSTGVKLIQALVGAAGKAKSKYSRNGLTWAMNETTYTKIMTELVAVTAAGQIVTGLGATMPVVGGQIVILPFMADDQIVAGHFDLYVLAERAGQKFAQSEHVRFLADQTVFKGTARYDGAPAIAEGFVAIGIGGTAPSATMTFPTDTANASEGNT